MTAWISRCGNDVANHARGKQNQRAGTDLNVLGEKWRLHMGGTRPE